MSLNPNNSQHQDETAPQDDQIIGKVFRYSMLTLLVSIGLTFLIYKIVSGQREDPQTQKSVVTAPISKPESPHAIPSTPFTDITESAGITFQRNSGAQGEKLLPEALGGGVAWLDYDQDGDADLLLINSTWWPWDLERDNTLIPTTHALYRNDSDPDVGIRFTDVTEEAGLNVPMVGMGVASADWNSDGFPDVYIACVGRNYFFENQGNGKFVERAEELGLEGDPNAWSVAPVFFDMELDGDLDLFVANYVQWNREIDFKVNFTIDGTHRAYGPPTDYGGSTPFLFRNDGDGQFEEVSQSSGVAKLNPISQTPASKSLGVSLLDFNRDGFLDIVVANDTTANQLFMNQKDGTFVEKAGMSGIAFDPNGRARGAMGIDTAFYRNNDDIGVVIGNFANEMTALYVTQGALDLFADEALSEGIGAPSRLPLKFGAIFWDYDLDGWQDILTVNGHLDEEIAKLQASQTYRQAPQVFWNQKGMGFVMAEQEDLGSDFFQPLVGRGGAVADVDQDGDLDLIITQVSGSPVLLRNDQGAGHHWLQIQLKGSDKNHPDAIGATVKLMSGDQSWIRVNTPTRGYLSQSEFCLHFGLGSVKQIDRIQILWPGGEETKYDFSDQPLNRRMTIHQNSGFQSE